MFSIFEIALQNANFKIVNVVIICIEMQWQRKKLFLSYRVCVIIKSVSEITASFINFETNKFGFNKYISFLGKYDTFKH